MITFSLKDILFMKDDSSTKTIQLKDGSIYNVDTELFNYTWRKWTRFIKNKALDSYISMEDGGGGGIGGLIIYVKAAV